MFKPDLEIDDVLRIEIIDPQFEVDQQLFLKIVAIHTFKSEASYYFAIPSKILIFYPGCDGEFLMASDRLIVSERGCVLSLAESAFEVAVKFSKIKP